MNQELEAKLAEKYPALFSAGGNMAFGCECNDGWYDLIKGVCQAITQHQEYLAGEGAPFSDFAFSQIKEKYGGLRLYHYGGDDFIEGVIDLAERLSYSICERCGNKGKPNDSGWITTLCEGCRREL